MTVGRLVRVLRLGPGTGIIRVSAEALAGHSLQVQRLAGPEALRQQAQRPLRLGKPGGRGPALKTEPEPAAGARVHLETCHLVQGSTRRYVLVRASTYLTR